MSSSRLLFSDEFNIRCVIGYCPIRSNVSNCAGVNEKPLLIMSADTCFQKSQCRIGCLHEHR